MKIVGKRHRLKCADIGSAGVTNGNAAGERSERKASNLTYQFGDVAFRPSKSEHRPVIAEMKRKERLGYDVSTLKVTPRTRRVVCRARFLVLRHLDVN